MKLLAVATAVALAGLAIPAGPAPKAADVLECNFLKHHKPQPSEPALVANIPGAMTPVPLNSVQIVDKSIRRKILPQAVFARRTETGTVEVMARLINCTDYDQQVLVRTSFMDKTQYPVEPVSAWQRVFMKPRSQGVYKEKSISFDVGYYLIEVDEGD